MLKDITLGAVFPWKYRHSPTRPAYEDLDGDLLHCGTVYSKMVCLLCCELVFLIVAVRISKVAVSTILRGMKPLIIIIILTGLLNIFYTQGEPLVKVWIFTITKEGILNAFFMIIRILMLVTGTFLLTYTTSPIALTDALEIMLSPLKKIKVPVHELSMMMCIALRFIPTLIEETDKIISAQKARGADFETGSLIRRAKALIPILVPLFISAFRRADELAVAMECRCYHGGEGRTRMKQLRYGWQDGVTLAIGLLMIVVVVVLRQFGL